MAEKINLPTLEIPLEFRKDREVLRYLEERDFVQYQLWKASSTRGSVTTTASELTANQQAIIHLINERIGTNDPLTSDETGFSVDSDMLTVDMTEANPNDLDLGTTLWGGIEGNIGDQNDLIALLSLKADEDTTQDALNTKLESIVAGTNITVDDTDPLNPVVSATGGSGGSGSGAIWDGGNRISGLGLFDGGSRV